MAESALFDVVLCVFIENTLVGRDREVLTIWDNIHLRKSNDSDQTCLHVGEHA